MDKRRTRALKASHHSRSTNRVHIHTGASAGAGQGGFGTEKGGGRRLARRPITPPSAPQQLSRTGRTAPGHKLLLHTHT
ncbi:hypothetical protein VYU27_001222 [Nannochloropsis oceanica]